MTKEYRAELTRGDDLANPGEEEYGLIIWLGTGDEQKAEIISDKICKHLEGLNEQG